MSKGKRIKQIIEDHEYRASGYSMLNGHSVEVLNIKRTAGGYVADIILHNDEDGIHETCNDCFYPMSLFEGEDNE